MQRQPSPHTGYIEHATGRVQHIWAASLIAIALAIGVFLRVPALLDDRTWFDEDAVILAGHGIAWFRPWPQVFHRNELQIHPTVQGVLTTLACCDAYPPLVSLTVYAVHVAPNPILATRAVYFSFGLAVPLIVFFAIRSLVGSRRALLVAAYVTLSPLLTVTGQLIKWNAAASLLATASTILLLLLSKQPSPLRWIAYTLSMVLLVHTHYFCIWLVPVHAVWVWFQDRDSFRAFSISAAVGGLLASPWFLWGLPSQRDYVNWFFNSWLASQHYNSWYQPFSIETVMKWYAYVALAAGGLQPSPVRVRYLLPVIGVLVWCIWKALASSQQKVRSLALIGVGAFGAALFGQTVYSWRLGHVTPLTASYFTPWFPLIMVVIALGAFEIRARAIRVMILGLLVTGTAFNGFLESRPPQFLPNESSLSHYRKVARVLESFSAGDVAIVHRSDRHAKLVNLFYRGRALQLVGDINSEGFPLRVGELLYLSTVGDPVAPMIPGWKAPETVLLVGHARVDVSAREANAIR